MAEVSGFWKSRGSPLALPSFFVEFSGGGPSVTADEALSTGEFDERMEFMIFGC